MSPRTRGLTSYVLLMGFDMLIIQLLALLRILKNLFVVIILLSPLINLDHICYLCNLNLNGSFLMRFGLLLLLLVKINCDLF